MAGTHGPSVMWYMQVSYKSGNVLRGEHDTVCIELIASSLEGTYHLCIRSRWCVFLETWNSAGLLEVTVCVSNPWLFWLWIYDMVVELLTIQDPSFLSFPCCANPPCCFLPNPAFALAKRKTIPPNKYPFLTKRISYLDPKYISSFCFPPFGWLGNKQVFSFSVGFIEKYQTKTQKPSGVIMAGFFLLFNSFPARSMEVLSWMEVFH